MPNLTIAVTGASGLVGRHLVPRLRAEGHTVLRVTRGEAGGSSIRWDPAAEQLDVERLRDVDAVIHVAGAPVAGRFTLAHKRRVLDSRRDGTRLVAGALATLADDGRPRALISASASGWYGPDRGDEWLTEDMPAGRGFLAQVCRIWEGACEPAREAGVRVVTVRTGIVQALDGGQLKLQLPLFRLGLGGPLGDGRQWMPWITVDDLVGIYARAARDTGWSGPVTAVGPGERHERKRENRACRWHGSFAVRAA